MTSFDSVQAFSNVSSVNPPSGTDRADAVELRAISSMSIILFFISDRVVCVTFKVHIFEGDSSNMRGCRFY